MTKAEELYRKVGDEYKQVKYFCGECGKIYETKEKAEECCSPIVCSVCGKQVGKTGNFLDRSYYINPIRCYDCYRKEQKEKEPRVTWEEYNGEPVVYNDDWYDSFEDFWDDFYPVCEEDVPDYVYLAEEKDLPKVNIDSAFESACEESGLEDAYAYYNNPEELYRVVKEWNDKQTTKYYEQTNRRLIIPEDKIKEIKDWLKQEALKD